MSLFTDLEKKAFCGAVLAQSHKDSSSKSQQRGNAADVSDQVHQTAFFSSLPLAQFFYNISPAARSSSTVGNIPAKETLFELSKKEKKREL